MKALQLTPACKDYLWGGQRLKTDFGVQSDLDPLAEADLYERFAQLVDGRTAVFISHRLSSCRFCDRVAVFEGGRVTQCGPHEQLMQQDGLYRRMFEAQAQYYV